jgi:hypothetical protein
LSTLQRRQPHVWTAAPTWKHHPDTFAEVEEFDCWLEDEKVDLEDAKHWFQIDILDV